MEHPLAKFFRRILREPQDTGSWGEEVAAKYLSGRKGYRILARNWRNPQDERHELDLVCADGEILVFVEVKTRGALSLERGYNAVNRRKKKALLFAAGAYLFSLPPGRRPRTLRFDIVEVTHCGRVVEPEVLHFENVPLFKKRFLA